MSDQRIQTRASEPKEIAPGAPLPSEPMRGEYPEYPLADDLPSIETDEQTAMQVFFAWEKLRVVYNGILLVHLFAKLSKISRNEFRTGEFLNFLLVINLFLSTGPVVEGYLCWLRVPRTMARWVAFLLVILGGGIAIVLS